MEQSYYADVDICMKNLITITDHLQTKYDRNTL